MTWKTFYTPDNANPIPIPVNMARVTHIERTRSPNDPSKWSGRVKLHFAKDHYLEVAYGAPVEAIIDELSIEVKDK